MSRKRKERPAEAVPDDVLAEGSGPVASEPVLEAVDAEPVAEGVGEPADVPAAELPTTAAAMDATQLKHVIEALIFASDKPVTVARLRQLTRISELRRIEQALDALAEDYRDRGLCLHQVSGGYQFRTRTQFSVWVQQLIAGRPVRLSRAQLETLAIIAYRQPITRPEIDDIRGVDSSQTLKLLLDRAMIRVLGKKEEVGRPILYGTTKEFLDFFSLGDLRELPTLREYSELTDESRRRIGEIVGDGPEDGGAGAAGDPDLCTAADDPTAGADVGFTAGSIDLDAIDPAEAPDDAGDDQPEVAPRSDAADRAGDPAPDS